MKPSLKKLHYPKLHPVFCLTTGPEPLPRRVLHRVRPSAPCFSFQHPPFSLRSSSSSLRLLPRFRVTSILPFNFPSIHAFEGSSCVICDQSSCPSLVLLYVRYFAPPGLQLALHFSHDRSNRSSPSFSSTTFQNFTGISFLLSEVSKSTSTNKKNLKAGFLTLLLCGNYIRNAAANVEDEEKVTKFWLEND